MACRLTAFANQVICFSSALQRLPAQIELGTAIDLARSLSRLFRRPNRRQQKAMVYGVRNSLFS
jgi:hypothetical protein